MDATTIQAVASVVVMVLVLLTLVSGWMFWLVRDLRTDMRTEVRDLRTEIQGLRTDLRTEMSNLRTEMSKDIRRNHLEIMFFLQVHAHEEDGTVVFRKLPRTSDD